MISYIIPLCVLYSNTMLLCDVFWFSTGNKHFPNYLVIIAKRTWLALPTFCAFSGTFVSNQESLQHMWLSKQCQCLWIKLFLKQIGLIIWDPDCHIIYIFYDIYPKMYAQVHMGPGLSGTSWKTSLCSCQVPFSSFLGAKGGDSLQHMFWLVTVSMNKNEKGH